MLFDNAILVGKIRKCNSSKGDVAVVFTDPVVAEGNCKYLVLDIDGLKVPFTIKSRVIKGHDTLYVRFAEVKNENDAKRIAGARVYCPEEYVNDEEYSDIFSPDYLIGYTVYDKNVGLLGVVTGVDYTSINTLLFVKGENDLIIPFNEEFLVNFNPRKRILRLVLPEGLTDINK